MRRYHAVGGMQLQVYLLTQALARLGIHQDVLTVRPPWTEALEEWANVRVHRFGWSVATPRQMFALPALRRVLSIARSGFDLVHVHSAQDIAAIPIALVAAHRASIPIIITLHNSWRFTYNSLGFYQSLRHRIGRWAEMVGLQHADAVVTLTEGTARLISTRLESLSERIFVIPDGVDLQHIRIPFKQSELSEFLSRYSIPEVSHKILYLGRLSREKGVIYLIRAVGHLRRQGICPTLILAGDGPDFHQIKQELAQNGITDSTILTRFIHHDDVPLLLAASDVLVLPSLFEEFGGVLLEAMALGKTIVASKVGGIPFTIRHMQNGLLVNPGDPLQIAEALTLVLSNAALAKRLGEQASLDAEHYDMSHVAKSLVDKVYTQCLNHKAKTN